MRALILEDDYYSNNVISSELRAIGFIVDQCFEGECAMDFVHSKQHDIYILDINVANFDGYDVLKYILERYASAPVLMISTHTEIEYLKKAFSLGCHDFLKKPFEIEELMLRMKNILRIANVNGSDDIVDMSQGYTYSLNTNQLFYYNANIELTKIESLLLRVLVKNIGNIVTLEIIKSYVWDNEEISPTTLRYWIHMVMKKINNGMIVNTRGVGYRLRKFL